VIPSDALGHVAGIVIPRVRKLWAAYFLAAVFATTRVRLYQHHLVAKAMTADDHMMAETTSSNNNWLSEATAADEHWVPVASASDEVGHFDCMLSRGYLTEEGL